MTLIQLRRWLQAQIRWCQAHPESDERLCNDAAAVLRDARRKAISAGLPAVADLLRCESDLVSPSAAAETLASALATVPTDRLLSVPEVARRLGVSPERVRAWIKAGELTATNTGKARPRYRITADALATFEAARSEQPVKRKTRRTVKLLVQRY